MARALLSVSDKRGLIEFAKELIQLGWEIVSSGGTAKALRDAGIPAIPVPEVTGFPEMLEGRVKTLHPNIHGAILAKGTDDHLGQLKERNITPIDLVVVNLYPFQETIAKPDVTLEDAIENIDIGGPAMVRASAKNYSRVAIVVNPDRYETIIQEIKSDKAISLATRKKLALEAFQHTAQYDQAISQYLAGLEETEELGENFSLTGKKVQSLRYGENPHQKAAFYSFTGDVSGTLAGAKQLHGKELSYNNLVDLQAAWSVVQEFSEPVVAIIKHTNPCGTATGDTIENAYELALEADPVSAFGGIIGLNKEVNKATAEKIIQTFMEAVIAPAFTEEALEVLTTKKNLRLLAVGTVGIKGKDYWVEPVSGGFLVQETDNKLESIEDWQVVTEQKPTDADMKELFFVWKVCKHAKSNAIVLSKNGQTVGVGAGQMNRVGAAIIALEQAREKAKGSFLASDAFFPFRDTIDTAVKYGVKAIIQPGGSVRDEESIQAANEAGIVMIFTGTRHFKH